MTITRRQHLLRLACLSVLFASANNRIGVSAKEEKTEFLILQLGDLLGKAADAISKLGDSIAHLVTLGAQGYDAGAARKAHADLIELRANLEKLISGQNIPLIKSINEYVEAAHSTARPGDHVFKQWWVGILDKVQKATEQVDAILKDVSKIRNEFVLE